MASRGETESVLLSIKVTFNDRTLVQWTILPFSRETSVSDLINEVFAKDELNIPSNYNPQNMDDLTWKVFVSKSRNSEKEEAFHTVKASELAELFGRYFQINIEQKQKERVTESHESSKRNAFAILMDTQERLVLPPGPPCRNKRDNLTKLVTEWLSDKGLGFTRDTVETIGKNFISVLTNALWYIDPYIDTMIERSCHVPKLFDRFFGMNDPRLRKQKPSPVQSMNVLEHASNIDIQLELPFMQTEKWRAVRDLLTDLSTAMHKYVKYLEDQRIKITENHGLVDPVRSPAEAEKLILIFTNTVVKPTFKARYKPLVDALSSAAYNDPICIDDFTPDDTQDRRYYLKNLPVSIPMKVYMFTYAYGNNLGTYHYIWKVDPCLDENETLGKNSSITNSLRDNMPKFHTREMRKKFINFCGRICNVNASYLRTIYKRLSGDNSVSDCEISQNVDERIMAAWEAEDPDIVVDLRGQNEGRPSEYSVFFEKCRIYLENVVEEVVDDRRHDKLTYLASAISIPDLRNQVAKTCDKDTPIPSEQWLRYQFAPKNAHAAASFRHTGNLNIKYMVQSRVFRKKHEDDHYCAALFRYLREMAIKHRDNTNFIAMDDKHYCKVGEPGNPLAAVDRGRQVLVAGDKILAASDHDFAKMSIVPSVTMKIDIPETITETFYRGQVYVGLKDHIFEGSSPIRHMSELKKVLSPDGDNVNVKPILLMYTDGGPDHRVNFLSVKASLICLFRALDLDMLVAARTAPNASWRNPPERIMSILNLALNCVGLMRKEMDQEFETQIKSCNTMNDIRAAANKHEGLREAVGDSLESVKILLGDLFGRLSLKDKKFEIFQAASEKEIDDLWLFICEIDNTISPDGKQGSDLKGKESLSKFIDHCCVSRHYTFCIKKCGVDGCDICFPPRLGSEVFSSLYQLPDPVPDGNHYKPFDDLYGKVSTSEEFRPSLQKKQVSLFQKIPFGTSAQTANSVKETVSCSECGKPRVLYARHMLSAAEKHILCRFLQFYVYSCGSNIQDLMNDKAPKVSKVLEKVYIRQHSCHNDIETPYYSSKAFKDICCKCGTDENLQSKEGSYPICPPCNANMVSKCTDSRRKRSAAVGGKNKGAKKSKHN